MSKNWDIIEYFFVVIKNLCRYGKSFPLLCHIRLVPNRVSFIGCHSVHGRRRKLYRVPESDGLCRARSRGRGRSGGRVRGGPIDHAAEQKNHLRMHNSLKRESDDATVGRIGA